MVAYGLHGTMYPGELLTGGVPRHERSIIAMSSTVVSIDSLDEGDKLNEAFVREN